MDRPLECGIQVKLYCFDEPLWWPEPSIFSGVVAEYHAHVSQRLKRHSRGRLTVYLLAKAQSSQLAGSSQGLLDCFGWLRTMADDPVAGTLEGSRMVPAKASKAEFL